MVSILATVERGIAAGGATAGASNPWPVESYTSRRNPKQFALAEVRATNLDMQVVRSTPLD